MFECGGGLGCGWGLYVPVVRKDIVTPRHLLILLCKPPHSSFACCPLVWPIFLSSFTLNFTLNFETCCPGRKNNLSFSYKFKVWKRSMTSQTFWCNTKSPRQRKIHSNALPGKCLLRQQLADNSVYFFPRLKSPLQADQPPSHSISLYAR